MEPGNAVVIDVNMRIVGRDIEMLHSMVTGLQFAIKLNTGGPGLRWLTVYPVCSRLMCTHRVWREGTGSGASDSTPIWQTDAVRIGRVFVASSVGAMRPSPLALPVRRTHAIRPSFGESHQAGSVASSSIASSCASAVMAKSISSGQGGDASSASGDAIRQVARPAARPQRMSSIESPTKRHLMRRPIRGHHSSSRGKHLS